ncbi:MAG: Bax inhibitor-1/YccA family protein [Actinomycetaceae bacterium]|nr:Bax inhibitor-1/YccA family protein [Actinomycetaceae bacterium]MDY6083557.1 Bax inhibitor-1/YccA family protein [Actinomycetaceae bacterium]
MADNPVIARNPYFKPQTTPNMGERSSSYGRYAQNEWESPNDQWGNPYGVPASSPEYQRAQQEAYARAGYGYQAPAVTMTYDDAMIKTFILLGSAVAAGLLTVMLVPLTGLVAVAGISTIAAFVFGMIGSFQMMVKPWAAVGYAVLEGVALGALTGAIDTFYPGVALQAVLATAVVVAVAAGLHFSGKVRTTSKGNRVMMVMLLSAIVYSLINMVMNMFGSRGVDYAHIGGMPVGIVVGLVMIVVGAYMLIGDLEMVKFAVANRAPAEFAWTVAFGLVMTVLWIYVEVLHTLAIFASDNN